MNGGPGRSAAARRSRDSRLGLGTRVLTAWYSPIRLGGRYAALRPVLPSDPAGPNRAGASSDSTRARASSRRARPLERPGDGTVRRSQTVRYAAARPGRLGAPVLPRRPRLRQRRRRRARPHRPTV
eukprot:747955-Hanusia_phi.AAC.2